MAGGRSVVAGDLITPGAVVRVLGDADQLHMSVTHLLYVISQKRSRFPVVIERGTFIFRAFPGGQLQLVDRQRLLYRVLLRAFCHPLLVVPGKV